MNPMLRNALRKHRALRDQLDNLLLGDEGDVYETELRKFVAKRTCWPPASKKSAAKKETTPQVPLSVVYPKIQILRDTPKPCALRSADEQIAGMKTLYKAAGWDFTESGLVVPERRKGFDRLIAVADTTLTNNCAFGVCKASFPSYRYENDLDIGVPSDKDERHPSSGVYAVWFRDRQEADEELKNTSAIMIAEKGTKTITLLERGLFELVYFMETGQHLDIKNWTLCSGSRSSGGGVPHAYWRGGRFYVGWCNPGDRHDRLRSREAVSL